MHETLARHLFCAASCSAWSPLQGLPDSPKPQDTSDLGSQNGSSSGDAAALSGPASHTSLAAVVCRNLWTVNCTLQGPVTFRCYVHVSETMYPKPAFLDLPPLLQHPGKISHKSQMGHSCMHNRLPVHVMQRKHGNGLKQKQQHPSSIASLYICACMQGGSHSTTKADLPDYAVCTSL